MIQLVELKTRDIAVGDIANPIDLNTAQYGFHRTSPWRFVESFSYRIVGNPRVNPDFVNTIVGTAARPAYTCEGHKKDINYIYILRPLHQLRMMRSMYIPIKEGGEQ